MPDLSNIPYGKEIFWTLLGAFILSPIGRYFMSPVVEWFFPKSGEFIKLLFQKILLHGGRLGKWFLSLADKAEYRNEKMIFLMAHDTNIFLSEIGLRIGYFLFSFILLVLSLFLFLANFSTLNLLEGDLLIVIQRQFWKFIFLYSSGFFALLTLVYPLEIMLITSRTRQLRLKQKYYLVTAFDEEYEKPKEMTNKFPL